MTKGNEGGVRVERGVGALSVDDPFLNVMAEIISLPQRIVLNMALNVIGQITEAKQAEKECEFNSRMAQEKADLYRSM